MKFVFAHSWIPVPVFYQNTDGGHRAEFRTKFGWCWINIEPRYKDDVGLSPHELQHADDYYSAYFTYPHRYNTDDWYRFETECKGYARQYLAYPAKDRSGKLELFAKLILTNYNLNFDVNADIPWVVSHIEAWIIKFKEDNNAIQ